MTKTFYALLTASIFLLNGCVTTNTNKPIKKYYTNTEYSKMTYCIGITDIAMVAATAKLRGTPKQELLDYYAAKSNSQLQIATVNKVYNAKFKNSWDYTVVLFDECALNLAGVVKQRVNLASFCLQNTLIANATFINKKKGLPKTHSIKHFSVFKSKTPPNIIDRVYASNKSRAEIKLNEWNICMQPISD